MHGTERRVVVWERGLWREVPEVRPELMRGVVAHEDEEARVGCDHAEEGRHIERHAVFETVARGGRELNSEVQVHPHVPEQSLEG